VVQLDGLVSSLNEAGFHVDIGPLDVFVSKSVRNSRLMPELKACILTLCR
jgi:DNA-directed RNA polymerase subunit E'/Rpb7